MEQLFLYFTFVYDWVNVLQLIAVSFSIVFVLSGFSFNKRGLLRFGAGIVCVFAAETLFNWLLFFISHYWKWLAGINFPLAHLIVITLYAAFVSKYNVKSRIVLSVTMFVTAIDMAELGVQTMRFFANPDFGTEFFGVLADLLIVGFAVLIRNRSIHIYEDIPKMSVAVDGVVSTASVTLVIWMEKYAVMNGLNTPGMFSLVLLYIYLVTVAIYIITYHHCTEHNAKLVLEVDKKLMEADIEMLSLSEQVAEEMREMRHDIKNQYLVMGVMLKEKRYDEMENYFNSMKTEFAQFPHFTDCGNAALNSIMNMETLKAASLRVNIISKINVPAELSVTVNDLCRILVNLIDNAMEAVQNLPEEERDIILAVKRTGNLVSIHVENRCAGPVAMRGGLPVTTKGDRDYHGYGMLSMRTVAEQYGGTLTVRVEDGVFLLDVVMADEPEEQEGEEE